MMIDQLLVHGLKDFPVDEKGRIVKGRRFSIYMAEKFKALLPLKESRAEILSCISVSHTIRSRKNKANLIAIVKFSNRDMRNIIFYAKKSLKGSKIAITEHLTPATLDLLNTTKKLFGRSDVWTSQTKVKVRVYERTYTIKSHDDAYSLKQWATNNNTVTNNNHN